MAGVPEMTPTSPLLTTTVLAAAAALALSGCSDSSGDTSDAASGGTSSPSATTSPAPSSSAADLPKGVELTPPGTQLAFGDTATVAFPVKKDTAYLDLRVDSAVEGSLKDFTGFDLDDPYKRKGAYYYVRVTVKNAGDQRTGGVDVPLWGISGDDTLLQAVDFTSSFKKCPTEQLPQRFKPGATFKTCLVYLSPNHGSLDGLSYRPEENDVPIEWQGQVKKLPKPSKKKSGTAKG